MGWEIPQSTREAFSVLHAHGVIDASLLKLMLAMVGFRNIAVRSYQELDLSIVKAIIEERLPDFRRYIAAILAYCS